MRKVVKAKAVERIATLRAAETPMTEICAELGISRSQVYRYIKHFGLKDSAVPKCPHCGVALCLPDG